MSGWYKCYLWGARGGSDACIGGNGGFVQTDIHLTAGQSYYVYVGASGSSHVYNTGAGYNGAGNAGADAGGTSGGGGGATDIRTISGSWNQNLGSRIVVAGGGGGGGLHSVGGVGGGLVGGTSPGGIRGGTQTSAGNRGGFGYGGNAQVDGGGGGGGWYGGGASTGGTPGGSNDQGGGGGSSYVGGRPEANTRNTSTIAGNAYMPIPFNEGATMLGNAGACYARIFLIEYDDMTLV